MILRDDIMNLCKCLCLNIQTQEFKFLDNVYYQHNRYGNLPLHSEKGNYVYFRENEQKYSLAVKKDTVKITGFEFAGNIRAVYVFRDLNPKGAIECLLTAIMECSSCTLLSNIDYNVKNVIQEELNYFISTKSANADDLIYSLDKYNIVALDFKYLSEIKVHSGTGCKEKCNECVDYNFINTYLPPWD